MYKRIIKKFIRYLVFKPIRFIIVGMAVCYMLSGCNFEDNRHTANKEETTVYANNKEETVVDENITRETSVTEELAETDLDLNDVPTLTSCVPSDLLDYIPKFNGTNSYVTINGSTPFFVDSELSAECYEIYSEYDGLGRCGVATACIGKGIMPTEEREEIGHVKPSGWHTVKYSEIIEDNYLYNRCHLIGYQLTGENDNEKNLITGTRFLNIDGMLQFENKVSEYIYKNPEYHVLYRVTPIYYMDNLVASGVVIEAKSVENDEISICVYCYNNQPGIEINYKTGESELTYDYLDVSYKHNYASVKKKEVVKDSEKEEVTYIVNTNTGKFHLPDCDSVKDMKEKNKEETSISKRELMQNGYKPCSICISE